MSKRSFEVHWQYADGRPPWHTYQRYKDFKDFKNPPKLQLYTPYKPYEYTVEYETRRRRNSEGRVFYRREPVYKRVENPDYVPTRRRYPYEGYHKMSDEARLSNRYSHRIPIPAVDYLERTSAAKKIRGFVGSWWLNYKNRKLVEALERGVEESRRRANIEVIDLTGDEPRVYKRHRPLNR